MFVVIINVLLVTSIRAATHVPDAFLCCSPQTGVFQHMLANVTGCWHEASGQTNPLPLNCTHHDIIEDDIFNVHVTETGQLMNKNPHFELLRGEVCFATDVDPDTNETLGLVALCTKEDEDSNVLEIHSTVLGFCMLVSAVFLLLTTLVYVVLPELRDLQGKSLINFCLSMGIGLAILAGDKLIPYTHMGLCAARGFFIYFFMVAAIFWTNAISIQVLLSLSRPIVNNYGWKEFCWYALYAWGCPTVLTLAMAIVNFHPGDHPKPGIGLNHCWFFSTAEQWYYFYSVMSILILSNICIFIYTSVHLWRQSYSSNHVKALKYKFLMTVRLFVIMGITWIFEMLSSLTEINIVWFVIDVFNALQGPLIFFLLVVFRKRVLKALLRHGYLGCLAGPVEKYLAVKEDDEEGVIQHTIDETMTERNRLDRNGI